MYKCVQMVRLCLCSKWNVCLLSVASSEGEGSASGVFVHEWSGACNFCQWRGWCSRPMGRHLSVAFLWWQTLSHEASQGQHQCQSPRPLWWICKSLYHFSFNHVSSRLAHLVMDMYLVMDVEVSLWFYLSVVDMQIICTFNLSLMSNVHSLGLDAVVHIL